MTSNRIPDADRKSYFVENDDGTVTIHWPINDNYFSKAGVDLDTKKHKIYGKDSCPYVNEDGTRLICHVNQFFFNGDDVAIDHEWERNLMTPGEIKRRHKVRTQSDLDAEFEKQNPDVVKILKLQNALTKYKSMNDKDFYELALSELDRRVQVDGEPDKPVVRQKLQDKISSL